MLGIKKLRTRLSLKFISGTRGHKQIFKWNKGTRTSPPGSDSPLQKLVHACCMHACMCMHVALFFFPIHVKLLGLLPWDPMIDVMTLKETTLVKVVDSL